jgi:hypothetical protein
LDFNWNLIIRYGKIFEYESSPLALEKGTRWLILEFPTDTPSGKYEELAEIKTRKLSKGEGASSEAKIKPKSNMPLYVFISTLKRRLYVYLYLRRVQITMHLISTTTAVFLQQLNLGGY